MTGGRDLTGEAETRALAERAAAVLRPGDTILLAGPIGAGKTAFARAAIQGLQRRAGQRPEDVPSPSYTLVQHYRAGPATIVHADLYRLADPDELAEMGLCEELETAITFIEWPELLAADLPDRHVKLTFEPGDEADARRLTVESAGAGWGPFLEALGAEIAGAAPA